jgi:hypothetical protein
MGAARMLPRCDGERSASTCSAGINPSSSLSLIVVVGGKPELEPAGDSHRLSVLGLGECVRAAPRGCRPSLKLRRDWIDGEGRTVLAAERKDESDGRAVTTFPYGALIAGSPPSSRECCDDGEPSVVSVVCELLRPNVSAIGWPLLWPCPWTGAVTDAGMGCCRVDMSRRKGVLSDVGQITETLSSRRVASCFVDDHKKTRRGSRTREIRREQEQEQSSRWV